MQLEKIQQEKSQQILTILNRLALFYKIIFFSIIAFLAVIIIKNFISGGIGDGIITLIFSVIVGIFAISFLFRILNSTVGKIQYSRCISLLKAQVSESAFNANVLHTNNNPPGIFAIDSQAKQVFVNNQQTGYYPVLLNKNTIIGLKVERESTIHTATKHRGNFAVFGNSIGYNFGSKSKSVSKIAETAFLEIQYRTENNTSHTLVIPYGSNRRAAEEAISTINLF